MLVVGPGPVIRVLKSEKLVNRLDCRGVTGRQANFASLGKFAKCVLYTSAPRGHNLSAGNRAVVHHGRCSEIARLKGGLEGAQMAANLRHAGRIGDLSLQRNAATIGKRLELMGRGILIDSHVEATAVLQGSKGAVGPGRRVTCSRCNLGPSIRHRYPGQEEPGDQATPHGQCFHRFSGVQVAGLSFQ